MIAKILAPRASSKSVLDYNEEKVMEGDAAVIDTENLSADDMATVYDTFEEFENNPAIAEQVKWKSFHMTLGPGPTDNVSEEECVKIIKELMEEMGYGEQPYIIYRHNDIDREHYHVVSPRIRRDGRSIDIRNEGRHLNATLKKLAGKYSFVVGADRNIEKTELPVLTTKEFSPKSVNVLMSLQTLFSDALRYEFHSLYQFQCVMASMNVRMTLRRRKDGGNNVILQGLGNDGEKNSRLYSMEKVGFRASELYEKRLAENNAIGPLQMDRKVAIRTISDYCLDNTGSALEYCSALEEAGIRHFINRDEESGQIRRVTLVEKNTYAIVDSGVRGELFLKSFTDAEKSGRWKKPTGKLRKLRPGAKVRKEGGPAFFTPERTRLVKELIANAIGKFRSAGKGVTRPQNGGGRGLSIGARKSGK